MPVNKQDRSKQPLRAGGNSPDKQSEAHGSSRGERIPMEPSDIYVGEAAPGRREFRGHGDTSTMFHGHSGRKPGDNSIERHNQSKDMGKKFVGGKPAGAAPSIPAEVQASERRHGAGNDPDGGHEHQMCGGGKEKISADINRS